ncbi:MAG: diacylglycerol kinase family protein [Bacteroidota bacterium]
MVTTWTLIRNPKASAGKCEKRWPAIAAALESAGIPYEARVTESPRHAIALTREAIARGARNFIAVGGDGTANEVANGILGQDVVDPLAIRLAQVPVGTGNDWGRSVGIPSKYHAAAALIREAPEVVQDVGRVEFTGENGPQSRYFINIAGMGYDAYVGREANRAKAAGKGGLSTYVSTVLRCLTRYEPPDLNFAIDGNAQPPERMFYLLVGICKYNGAGMKHCPHAIYDDGILDVTLIRPLSVLRSILNLPRLFNGSFVHLKEASLYTAQSVRVEASPAALLEVDGENIGMGPATFSILPRRLRVIGRGGKP